MSAARALYGLAKADFLERVRRYSFLVTLAFAIYVGLAVARGQISLRLGDYVGVVNSAWVGGLMSLTTTVFLSLVGFFIVSNSIHRDQLARVGSILAATPMSRFAYMLAKAISNFAVLSAMVVILALAGVVTVLLRHQAPLELGPLLIPFLLIALPGMAMVAAVAVFFEATPILRRISALAYLFFWVWCLAHATGSGGFDPLGMSIISKSMMSALQAIDPTYQHAISFGFIVGGAGASAHPRDFLWTGISWTPMLVLQHLAIFPLAAVIALVPALWFHRFDPARDWGAKWRKQKPLEALGPAIEPLAAQIAVSPNAVVKMTAAPMQRSAAAGYIGLIASELRLLAARRKWWAYAVVAGLVIAGFALPLEAARHGLMAAIWILPMLYWSRLGAREDHFATRTLIFSSPQPALRPLLSSWIAGVALPLFLASGVIVRLAIAGDYTGAINIAAGGCFVVALALAVGNLSRTPKAFEAVYVVWWYLGPMQGIPGIDFSGVTAASTEPLRYAILAGCLLVAAWGIRVMRIVRS